MFLHAYRIETPMPKRKDPDDVFDTTYPTKLSANLLATLKERKKKTGVPVATQIRQFVEKGLEGGGFEDRRNPLRLEGRICAGDGIEILDVAEGGVVYPPFSVPSGSRAFLVIGDSMETDRGRSIPDGSFVVFRDEKYLKAEEVVYASVFVDNAWKETIKVFEGIKDGKYILRPQNDKHRLMELDRDDCYIKGVYYGHWPEKKAEAKEVNDIKTDPEVESMKKFAGAAVGTATNQAAQKLEALEGKNKKRRSA
jgi:SOS-response transcriptional repressor LexA